MLNLKNNVSSSIHLDVVDERGDMRLSHNFSNIMTNYGLQSWTSASLGNNLAIGSGSREEVGSVTDLAGYITSVVGNYSYINSNYIDDVAGVMRSELVLNALFPIETVARNYSEMGIHSNNINALQTYARIRDNLGQPTSVSVQVGEQVRVRYIIQYSIPLSSVTEVVIDGVPTTITSVPLFSGSSNSIRLPEIYNIRFWPAGQPIPVAGVNPPGGVLSPRYGNINSGLFSLNIGQSELNLAGGISVARFGYATSSICMLCHYDPPIPKTFAEILGFTITSKITNGEYHA